MTVMGAVVVQKQLGIYMYGCGIKHASRFHAAFITMSSRILLHRQLGLILA